MGAGTSTSSVENINNQLIVNQSTIELMNQQNNSAVANTIIKNASNNTASIIQSQKLTIKNIKAKGDINLSNLSQLQQASLSFQGLNISQTTNDSSNAMLSSMMASLKSNIDNTTLAQMLANADAQVKSGALTIPGYNASDSSTTNISNTEIQNISNQKLQNIINNSITNNFTSDTVNNCISTVANNQEIQIGDLVSSDGSVNISAIDQNQAATAMVSCINQSGVSNKIMNDMANAFGIQIQEDKKNTATTEQTGTATATTETKGLLDGLAELLSSLFGGLLSGTASIVAVSSLLSLSCCCCCIILIVIIFMIFKQ